MRGRLAVPFVLVTVVATGFAGCLVEPEPQPYDVIETGGQTGFKDNEARLRVVTDDASFADFWANHTSISMPPPDRPEVDFAQRFVAALFLGQRPSGGYGVNVTGVFVEAGEYGIEYEEVTPGEGCAVTAVITHPFVILTLERQPGVGSDVALRFQGDRVVDCPA